MPASDGPDLLFALVSIARDREISPTRGRHARELVAPNLDDMQFRALLLDLEKRQAR